MLRVDDRVAPATLDQFMQSLFAFNQWQAAQILAVEPEQIESVEEWLTSAREQFVELTDAVRIKADDFTTMAVVSPQPLESNSAQSAGRYQTASCVLQRRFVPRL
jgi:hypothetical protein